MPPGFLRLYKVRGKAVAEVTTSSEVNGGGAAVSGSAETPESEVASGAIERPTEESVPDQDITKISDSTVGRLSNSAEDQLPTEHLPATRLPPISLPPLRSPSPSVPPYGAVPATNSHGVAQAPAPSLAATTEYRFAPNGAIPAEYDPMGTRRSLAVGCVVAACAFATISLVFAFRGAPSLGMMPPMVAASVVVANAILSVGAGAFGFGLLRIAERLSSSPNR